jgi:hypothetical protein
MKLHLARVKSRFLNKGRFDSDYIKSGKFKEVPGFEFFEKKMNELKDLI